MGRCTKRLFQGIGTHQRCGAVILVFLQYILRDVNPAVLGIQLLYTALPGEDMRKVVNAKRLLGNRMDGRHGFVRHVGLYVIPLGRDLTLR